MIWLIIVCAVIGYLLGSVNTSILIGKLVYKTDIRDYGSGNAGMTNTLRTYGSKATLLVIVGDILKGVLACIIGRLIASGNNESIIQTVVVVAGLAAIIGHIWPVYFNFIGGKGVLPAFAVITMVDWKIAIILFAIFFIIVTITRYVSLGSIICTTMLPIICICFGRSLPTIIFSILLAILIDIKHRANFKRIIAKTERKIGKKS